jgi:hypothetical protein
LATEPHVTLSHWLRTVDFEQGNMTKEIFTKPREGESYSEWSALDVAFVPDERSDRGSLHDFMAYVFAALALVILAIAFGQSLFGNSSSSGAGALGSAIAVVALCCASVAFGVLAIFFATMSSRHIRTRKVRLSHRSVFDATAAD